MLHPNYILLFKYTWIGISFSAPMLCKDYILGFRVQGSGFRLVSGDMKQMAASSAAAPSLAEIQCIEVDQKLWKRIPCCAQHVSLLCFMN